MDLEFRIVSLSPWWWYKYWSAFGGENIAQSWDASTGKCYVLSNDANKQGILNSLFIEEGKWNRKLQHVLKSEFNRVGVHSL